MNIVL